MVCECDDKSTRNYASYYDSPDGCDIPTKMMVASRFGVMAGLVISTYDVMMYSHAVGFSRILSRYALHVVPLGLMGATFAAVSNGALHYRREDDELNYFLGGAACAPILAAYVGSAHALLPGALILGAVAMVKKTAITCGHTFLPNVEPHMGRINSWRNDYTLAKDPKDDLIHSCGIKEKK